MYVNPPPLALTKNFSVSESARKKRKAQRSPGVPRYFGSIARSCSAVGMKRRLWNSGRDINELLKKKNPHCLTSAAAKAMRVNSQGGESADLPGPQQGRLKCSIGRARLPASRGRFRSKSEPKLRVDLDVI